MIITKQKPFEDIVEDLRSVNAKKVAVIGCGECATSVETGGKEQVDLMCQKLGDAGFEIIDAFVSDTGCHVAHVGVELRGSDVGEADAIVMLSCGAGTQAVADTLVDTVVFPGLDSLFMGNTQRRGLYEERCRLCGACGLGKTAGICPLTLCPKGLLNGPCGSMWDGYCGLSKRRCAHVLIRERLQAQGRPEPTMIPPKDYSQKSIPGEVNWRSSSKEGDA